MPHGRKAETPKARRWDGVVAEANELEEFRTWVVWGVSAPPETAAEPERVEERPGEPGNDVAERIAAANDDEWSKTDRGMRWVVVLNGDEDDIDEWVLEDESVRGYAPYLLEAEAAASEPRVMRGVLRGDVVRRRRFDVGRPS